MGPDGLPLPGQHLQAWALPSAAGASAAGSVNTSASGMGMPLPAFPAAGFSSKAGAAAGPGAGGSSQSPRMPRSRQATQEGLASAGDLAHCPGAGGLDGSMTPGRVNGQPGSAQRNGRVFPTMGPTSGTDVDAELSPQHSGAAAVGSANGVRAPAGSLGSPMDLQEDGESVGAAGGAAAGTPGCGRVWRSGSGIEVRHRCG